MKIRLSDYIYIALFLGFTSLIACSTTKFVPDGEYLLDNTNVVADTKQMKTAEGKNFIAQKPNFKIFSLFKFPLFIYNLSGRDSTKWINKTLRNAGEAPVVYDSLKVNKTIVDLTRMMTNKGFLDANVKPKIEYKKKKIDITYNIAGGTPYMINNYSIAISDSVIQKPDSLLYSGLRKSRTRFIRGNVDSLIYRNQLVKKGSSFDLEELDRERERMSKLFRRIGYYAFNKEHIGFVADTMAGNHQVDLDVVIYPFAQYDGEGNIVKSPHRQYEVESVDIYVDYDPIKYGDISEYTPSEVYTLNGYTVKYGERGKYISPKRVLDNCFIRPGSLFNELLTTHTYSALSQLAILKNVNISYHLVNEKLRCIITAVPDKTHGVSTELEGTNSGGFFGIGAGVGYVHRNIFKGSEMFNIGLKGAYEMVTPSFSRFDDNYFEIGVESGLTFPRFVIPFLNREFKQSVQASTKIKAGYTFQRRPGFFTRTVFFTGLQYQWNDRIRAQTRHIVDFIDISYVHLPIDKLNNDFLAGLSPGAQRYSFSDQFIVSSSYTFNKTNLRLDNRRYEPVYSLRASIESAGNSLSVIAKIAGEKRQEHGSRELFGTKFAQYLKGTVNYSRTYFMDENNSIAWHIGGGLAYPYGNYKEIPIQKRFFSGGGNSVRGWSVRKLGPGSFRPNIRTDLASVIDNNNFYYHSGDIKLDLNVEYRTKLFWILELGAFIDMGNIWTTRNYENQEGGKFEVDKFYKEIAAAWGLGLRFDFKFVLLRFDVGWKAYDPAKHAVDPQTGKVEKTERWPIKYPYKFSNNTAVHIAVGYPF